MVARSRSSGKLLGVEPRVLECPRCGAPLPRRAALVRVTCEYCKSEVVFERLAVKVAEYRRTLASYLGSERADVTLGGFRLRLHGLLAVGHSSDVFLASRAARLTERLVLKVLRSTGDEALAHNEQSVLALLAASREPGTAHFKNLVPQPAFSGLLEGSRFPRTFAAAFRQPPGLSHTFAQLRQSFAANVDPRHAIWMWRRALELLDWVHRSGFAHGALLPEHILVDAREHAVGLVGFSAAGSLGTPLTVMDARRAEVYPLAKAATPALSPGLDLTMLARSVIHALGGRAGQPPTGLPAPLAQLLSEQSAGTGEQGALAVGRRVSDVGRQCFGPPKFVKLELP